MSLRKKSFVHGCILVMILAILFIIPVNATTGWYNCNWQYRQGFTIDRTKVAGSLANFPVYISLASDPDL
ncbi:MAG TPA: hypothetical protein VMS81_07160, partial [Methanomicrobiales archaeon]|nr:hypothetical protein [Methanomicrobiales archaeon]